jgi:hypothetical protein
VEVILHNLVTKKFEMAIMAGKSENIALFMVTINFIGYQKKW